MAWANILVLGVGGLLMSIPIILHFLMQPKPQVLPFPALRFVRERQLNNRSRMRLRHVLLMLLRCLLILLMAAALAGPSVASNEFGQWLTLGGVGVSGAVVAIALALAWFGTRARNMILVGVLAAMLAGHVLFGGWSFIKLLSSDSAQVLGNSQAPVAALILVDTSPRMEYLIEDESNLERAKQMAIWLIEQFPSDSQICVMATDGDRPFWSVDIGSARKRVETLETTYLSSYIPESLSRGIRKMLESKLERKEVYVITDLTARSWTGADACDALEQLADVEGVGRFVIDVGQADLNNLALGDLELGSESVTTMGTLRIKTSIRSTGTAGQRMLRFSLEQPDLTKPQLRDRRVLLPEKSYEKNSK